MMDNYIVLESEYIDDIHSQAMLLEHIKTKAKIILLSNDDNQKVFSINFKTPVNNNKGIPHIIEHSVFCGSKKYPLKDPFVELMKGSMYTFLNAITYDESTMFPIASCHTQDFKNLMDVYLDAVFHPLFLEKKEIFLQEGWHYECYENHEYDYNGVVFNEMRGMETSPDFLLMNAIKKSLYPDTQYQYVAGGLSQDIVNLSYEEVIDFYQKYYHPSHCCIVLYGNMDMEERLNYLDKEYLSHFTKRENKLTILSQPTFQKPQELETNYPVENENEENQGTYLAYNIKLDNCHHVKTFLTVQILDYVLMSSPSAILKHAFIKKGIGKDFDSILSTEIKQPFYSLIAMHAYSNQKEEFLNIIQETFYKLVRDGIHHDILAAAIHNIEYLCREEDYGQTPKGMIYAGKIYECMLFDEEHPFERLKTKQALKEIKNEISNGYFENFIQKYFIDNQHYSCVKLEPNASYLQEKETALYASLDEMIHSIDEQTWKGLVEETQLFLQYQEELDSSYAMKTIPVLQKSQIELEEPPIFNQELEVDGVPFLFQELPTEGIGYLKLLFDLRYIKKELWPYAGLLVEVLGLLDTQNYTYQELNEKVDKETGGIFDTIQTYHNLHKNDISVTFESRSRFMYDEIPTVFELIKETLFNTKYQNTDRLYELLLEVKSLYMNNFIQNGHQVALQEIMCQYSLEAAYQDIFNGLSFYKFIKNILDNYENMKNDVCQHLKEVSTSLFHKEHLIVSYTGERQSLSQVQKYLSFLLDELEDVSQSQLYQLSLPLYQESIGFSLASQVQCVAMGGQLPKEAKQYRGHFMVLNHILNCEYLWQRVRVLGGAYGCQAYFNRDGFVAFVSYRDPQTVETIQAYHDIVHFMKNLTINERQIRQYIIGTLNSMNMPMSNATKGLQSMFYYMCGITKEELIHLRQQIIDTTPQDIVHLTSLIERMLKDVTYCIVGNEDKISECQYIQKIQSLL